MTGAAPPESEILFGRMLIEQKLVKFEHVEKCLRTIASLVAQGVTPLPMLGELLVRSGYLAVLEGDATVRVAQSPPAGGRPAATTRPEAKLPEDVARAAEDSKNVLGKYVTVVHLGAGGLGDVWKAWDRELNRWVALKILKYDNAVEIERFMREAQTAGKLSHPHIAAIHDVGAANGRNFIAMQFIEGETLLAFPRDDVRALVAAVRQAALAVHYANEQDVIHRDLKPANIMVARGRGPQNWHLSDGSTPASGGLQVFVLDFGLAKTANVHSSLSVAGSIVGTPSYMSPEQARGEDGLDARSDVYSLGATLYELLTDRKPFEDENVYAVIKKVIEEDVPRVRKIRPRISADLETIVMKCLEKSREQRYGTALELAEDLGRWLSGEAIQAHPPSLVYRMKKRLARRKGVAAGISVAAFVALCFAGYWMGLSNEAQGWAKEAARKAEGGEYEEAKRLLDQARTRIVVDNVLYSRCEEEIAKDRALSKKKRQEDEIFGPILKRLESLSADAEGWQQGLRLLDEGLSRFGDSWEAWMKKGQLHEKLEDLDEALVAYQRAYAINPHLQADAAVSRGTARHARGDFEAAIAEYDAALKINPRHLEARANRGRARVAKGDPAGAIADLEIVLAVAPHDWPLRKVVSAELERAKARGP